MIAVIFVILADLKLGTNHLDFRLEVYFLSYKYACICMYYGGNLNCFEGFFYIELKMKDF